MPEHGPPRRFKRLSLSVYAAIVRSGSYGVLTQIFGEHIYASLPSEFGFNRHGPFARNPSDISLQPGFIRAAPPAACSFEADDALSPLKREASW